MSISSRTISELMTRRILKVSRDELLSSCAEAMESHKISALLVEEEGKPAGILTERDILRAFSLNMPPERHASDLMSRSLVTIHEHADYRDAYQLLAQHRIRHLVVVDAEGVACGIVSETDFRNKGGMEGFVGLREVASVMNSQVPVLPADTTILEAARLMDSYRSSCVLVAEGGRPLGIVTERDMVRLYRLDIGDRPIETIMSSPVVTIGPDDAVIRAVQRMQSGNIRHLAVVNGDGETLGMISEHDVVKQMEGHYVEILNELISEQAQILNENREKIEELTLKAALAETERHFRDILEYAPIGMAVTAQDGRFLQVNQALCDIVGSDRAALEEMSLKDIVHPEDFPETLSALDALLRRDLPSCKGEKRCLRRGGETIWVRSTATLMKSGEENHFIIQLEDINDWKMAEEKLQLAGSIYLASSEAMMVTDSMNRIVDVNPAFTEITGYDREEVIGKDPGLLDSGRHEKAFFDDMHHALESQGQWEGEVWNRRKNGELYVEWLIVNVIRNAQGAIQRHVSQFTDITEKKRTSELIWRQANYDYLTELPNRRLFLDRLNEEIKKSRRSQYGFALLFIDLDRFKEINDLFGHRFGDKLLVEAARRIVSCLRESDTVSRFGGDEFVVMLPEVKDPSQIGKVAQAVIDALARPYKLEREVAFLSGSMGVTAYPEDAESADKLLSNADQALFTAKSEGRNRYSYFTQSMQDASRMKLQLGHDLHGALGAGQFELNYQPIADLESGEIYKCEALLRWHHPAYGMVSPAEFVPISERLGLINEIGDWVFRESAKFSKECSALLGRAFRISINVSPVQFMAGAPKDQWIAYLETLGLSGENVLIEITEGLLLKDRPEVDKMLLDFRDAGIAVVIDDFGTGYSSLAYLRKFHIDYLKIDQAFTRNLTQDPGNLAISEAIIVMAHKLGIKVIAEGIENAAQRNLLLEAGCDFGQGLFYSSPLSREAFLSLLQSK